MKKAQEEWEIELGDYQKKPEDSILSRIID